MTVGELRKLLEQFPDDYEVVSWNYYQGFDDIRPTWKRGDDLIHHVKISEWPERYAEAGKYEEAHLFDDGRAQKHAIAI